MSGMLLRALLGLLRRVRFCASPAGLPPGTIVLFPVFRARVHCGIAGIVEIVRAEPSALPDPTEAERVAEALPRGGGEEAARALEAFVDALRRPAAFPALFRDGSARRRVAALTDRLGTLVAAEEAALEAGDPPLSADRQEAVNRLLTRVKDAAWALSRECLGNLDRVAALLAGRPATDKALRELRKANLVLNAIDRMEIRGRDSAGILFQAHFPERRALGVHLERHAAAVAERSRRPDFTDGAVSVSDDGCTATLVYKVAAEVGKLGDNVAALRASVRADDLLHALLADPAARVLVTSHTRWASNGIINLQNCHPLDNECAEEGSPPALSDEHPAGHRSPRIHVALNGDIDNYLELRRRFEEETGRRIPDRITTDAKVIALWVDYHLRRGEDLTGAFRLAVRDFTGSAAILMVSDLAPGRVFLSLKGSGQSLYVGLGAAGYVVASEIYGLVEETPRFLVLDGKTERVPGDEGSRGEVVLLAPEGEGRLDAVRAVWHDGAPVALTDADVRRAEITTRDVDRGDAPHFFLKEVSQAPDSVAKTLRGKFGRDGRSLLGPETIPSDVRRLLRDGRLERVVIVGQGTASVAGMAIGAFVGEALRGARVRVEALKASELSGFGLDRDMTRTLVVAVTQSGATADTNRAVDLAKERGAHTVAIVNRRNSDITFKTAGVLYTSDGRDVEMSVASTKAFYSQVVAGALLALTLGLEAGTVSAARARREVDDLRRLPDLMREVLALAPRIEETAARWAPTRRYWAVVGSGPNRIAAEEVRIKLSELCYKSISADSVEDKKHIDLSSESLILVLAAGHETSVLADLAKDVAIFKAHRAVPIVFATRGERRFDAYAAERIELPPAPPLLSMVLGTMAGHLFGYHAAQAIDEGGKFLGRVRGALVSALDRGEALAAAEFRRFEREFGERLRARRFDSSLEPETAVDLSLLMLCAAGELPPLLLAERYGREARGSEVSAALLERLVQAIDQTLRPVDAIKHQAKIVTVGTSRPAERPTGVLFDALAAAGIPLAALTFSDRSRLAEVQPAVDSVAGVSRYEVEGLDVDGSPEEGARLRLVSRTGLALDIPSRAQAWTGLKGTKRTVVKERRAFVGVGAKDGRMIAILPLVDPRFSVTALALLHLSFREEMPVAEKVAALGERYDEVVNGVTEADVPWSDDLLAAIPPAELLTTPPARLAERLIRDARR